MAGTMDWICLPDGSFLANEVRDRATEVCREELGRAVLPCALVTHPSEGQTVVFPSQSCLHKIYIVFTAFHDVYVMGGRM